mmetsp:Transcript_6379/g.8870  ORF Transcript_6379/g.8870 Transcript_6379/m.8870 type:complete len:143 (-) Transcript_6379:1040-1468(-)
MDLLKENWNFWTIGFHRIKMMNHIHLNDTEDELDVPTNVEPPLATHSPNHASNDPLDAPLFDGRSKVTLRKFQRMFLSFIVKFTPSKELLRQVLHLINQISPQESNVPSSLYMFEKILDEPSFQRHEYCEECRFEYEDDQHK